jgi:polyphosphate kinase
VILAAVPYQDRAADVDFVPDPDIVIPGAHELALMEAERIRSGKFAG